MNLKVTSLTFKSSFCILFFSQIFVYLLIFGPLSLNKIGLDINLFGDFPSYWLFDFSSIKVILGQHRTFGFPLIIKIYRSIDYDLTFWPKFIYIFFSLSNLFLFYSFNRINLDKIFSLFFLLGLTVSQSLLVYLTWWTELLGISFLIITLGLLFLSIKTNKTYYYLLFSIILFFCYQIRPSFVIFAALPVLFCVSNYLFFNKNLYLKKITFFSFFPLIIFIIIRYFLIGSFGLVSFNSNIAATALVHLTEDQIPLLKTENQKIAKSFLERKRKLPYPCNLDLNQDQISYFNRGENLAYKGQIVYGQYPCWNMYQSTAWLELIKINLNIEPFPNNKKKNLVAWEHVPTLANFWQIKSIVKKNVEIDDQLINFSNDVIKINYKQILKKIIKSPVNLMKLQRDKNGNLLIFYIIMILPVFFFIKQHEIKNKNHKYEFALTFSFLIITIPNLIIISVYANGDPRVVVLQTFYLIPIFMSYLIFLIHTNLNKKIEV